MSENPQRPKFLFVIIIALVLVAIAGYMFFSPKDEPKIEEASTVLVPDTSNPTTPDTDEEIPNLEEAPMIDFTTWATVDEEGYEFMHPDYFIQDNDDHYIMAVEPRVGQEFTALVIYKPAVIADPMALMQQKITDQESSVGANVTMEPQQITLDGFKSAYAMEYEIESGPTTGANKFFVLQSPYTDEYVTIEYAENDNAETIMRSFRFVEE